MRKKNAQSTLKHVRKTVAGFHAALLIITIVLVLSISGRGQTLTNTIPISATPSGVSINPVTNKLYVCDIPANNVSNITVIDGSNNLTTTIPGQCGPLVVHQLTHSV